ncbi:hypothetical protein BDW62DRAFT_189342 [Aspergillus aurantiobrunneus]
MPQHEFIALLVIPPLMTKLLALRPNKSPMDEKLEKYQSPDPRDDTAAFLKIFFEYIPLHGKKRLAEDVARCSDDDALRKLAESLDTGLLRPMLSTRLKVDRSIRDNCLARDGHRCVVSGAWSSKYDKRPPDSIDVPLEAAHITPLAWEWLIAQAQTQAQTQSQNQDQENSTATSTITDERYRNAEIWKNLNRYLKFPDSRSRLRFPSSSIIKQEDNVLMMAEGLRPQFEMFHFILEATKTPNRYRVREFQTFPRIYLNHLPPDRVVTLKSHDGRYPVPSPQLLAIHAAIGNILHLSSRGVEIEELKQKLAAYTKEGLAGDGSTKVGDLLSVSKLAMLISSGMDERGPEKKRRLARRVGHWGRSIRCSD